MKDDVLNCLRAHQKELSDKGVTSLALFGSVARGDDNGESDIDLMAEFKKGMTLLELAGIEDRLTELVGSKVDLSDRRMLKDFIRPHVEREAIRVF